MNQLTFFFYLCSLALVLGHLARGSNTAVVSRLLLAFHFRTSNILSSFSARPPPLPCLARSLAQCQGCPPATTTMPTPPAHFASRLQIVLSVETSISGAAAPCGNEGMMTPPAGGQPGKAESK
ncbi:hypothetical protein VFPBJ_07093 [Purpureocillium lilacinum]|uniref:Secreted protein n=1 Tax=Purpureocillium lilacinum TaxID=33203 RepID=A0A179GMH0_PURLI|nr:hypothetical protein VFPBJ_07093 [Purpureocillium lilacinum]